MSASYKIKTNAMYNNPKPLTNTDVIGQATDIDICYTTGCQFIDQSSLWKFIIIPESWIAVYVRISTFMNKHSILNNLE